MPFQLQWPGQDWFGQKHFSFAWHKPAKQKPTCLDFWQSLEINHRHTMYWVVTHCNQFCSNPNFQLKKHESRVGMPPGSGYSRSRTIRLCNDDTGIACGSPLLLTQKVPDEVWRSSSRTLLKRNIRQVKASNGTTQMREAVQMEGTVTSKANKKHLRQASTQRISWNEISPCASLRHSSANCVEWYLSASKVSARTQNTA